MIGDLARPVLKSMTTMDSLSPDLMRSSVAELEQALFNHEQWCEGLYSTLICRLPPDQRDMEVDAHRRCRFGQWYYGTGSIKLSSHRGFEEIAIEHQRMHQYAATLLNASTHRVPISVQDYERFDSALKRMRLEIATLKHDIEDALYNLDPLTGAASRIGMLTKLREEQELVKRKVHSCCLAMMDLDDFKNVNDTHGHAIGDRVLVGFARYVMAHLRPYDKFFRYGGEEFLLCATGTDLVTGTGVVNRLREEVSSIAHEGSSTKTVHVTVSVGITLLDPDVSVEESIDRADKALYLAKSRGRNQTVVWDASML
ncbi:MAG: diguanylate cyclase [Acidobacteriia bacterium]|nr:diguanylate cyclase [Terriglobia bacterium]